MKSLLRKKDLKYLPALLAILLIGIALLVPWQQDKQRTVSTSSYQKETGVEEQQIVTATNGLDSIEFGLEQRLENILSKIKGVGKVEVTLLLASGPRYDYAVNVSTIEKQVDEKDQSGGIRTTTEVTEDGQLVIVRSDRVGGEEPVVAQEYKPEIQGVLVVADGAENPKIKSNLLNAITTILDLDPHKVDIQSKE
jgi:stage III sporulation protein AG